MANRTAVKDLLNQSSRAVCGTMEREITVPSTRAASTVARLRAAGFQIVGMSLPGSNTRKIWFVSRGFGLL